MSMKVEQPSIITAPSAFPRDVLDTHLLPALQLKLEQWRQAEKGPENGVCASVAAFQLLDDAPGTPLEDRRLNYVFWGECAGRSFVAGGTLSFKRTAHTWALDCRHRIKLTVNPAG